VRAACSHAANEALPGASERAVVDVVGDAVRLAIRELRATLSRMATKRSSKGKTAKPAAASGPFFQPFAALGPSKRTKKTVKPAPAPPPAPPREVEPPVSDADTFALHMAGVRVLGGGATRIPATASRVEKAERGALPAVDLDVTARERLDRLVVEGIRFEIEDDGHQLEGRRVDVDPRELRRLRHGAFAIDGRLDLHGLTVVEARKEVEAFVKKRRAAGDRMVKIIHGKGTHSPGNVAVLRGEIGAWLSQGRAAHSIAAFTSAPDDEGGTGALFVLLAK
jgi:DNA-nicking Smr family endonuclease